MNSALTAPFLSPLTHHQPLHILSLMTLMSSASGCPLNAQAAGTVTLYQHKRDALYNTTVAGAGAGGVAASSDVWAVMQAHGLTSLGGGAAASVTRAAVSQLADETACWREVQVEKAPLDALLSEGEAASARVVKIDVEGGEWAVLRGMRGLLAKKGREPGAEDLGSPGVDQHALEVVVEVTPKWLAQQSCSVARLFHLMASFGFHPYVLPAEDYEVERAGAAVGASASISGAHGGEGEGGAGGGGAPAAKTEQEGEAHRSYPDLRPRRLRGPDAATSLEAVGQVDIVFSRRDVEWL